MGEDTDEVVEGVMVAGEEEATVVVEVAEDMTAVPIADTIAAKTETVDQHPSRRVKKLMLQSTLSGNEEMELHEATTSLYLCLAQTKVTRSR